MQIIVEDGKGRPDANSFVLLEKLTFYVTTTTSGSPRRRKNS
ncbi:DnaT-like ssDNA-binding protein [Pseudomonas mandelii]